MLSSAQLCVSVLTTVNMVSWCQPEFCCTSRSKTLRLTMLQTELYQPGSRNTSSLHQKEALILAGVGTSSQEGFRPCLPHLPYLRQINLIIINRERKHKQGLSFLSTNKRHERVACACSSGPNTFLGQLSCKIRS